MCVFISKPDLGFVTQATSCNYRAAPSHTLMDRSLNEHVYKSATMSQKGSTDDLVSGNKSCSSPSSVTAEHRVLNFKKNPGTICVILLSSEH